MSHDKQRETTLDRTSLEAFKGKRLGVVQASVQDDFATNGDPCP